MELRRVQNTSRKPLQKPSDARRDFRHIRKEKPSERTPVTVYEEPRRSLQELKADRKKKPSRGESDSSWDSLVFEITETREQGDAKKEEKGNEPKGEKTRPGKQAEQERKAKEDDKKARQEEDRKAKEDDKKAKEDDKKAKEDDKKARQEEERKARKGEERKAKQEEKKTDEVQPFSIEKIRPATVTITAKKEKDPTMTKLAFVEPDQNFNFSQRLNHLPHIILIVCLSSGIVFMLSSVGSNQWMRADVSGVTVHYGMFERCVTNPLNDVTICETFDWPGWLYGPSQEKMHGIRSIAICSIFFACLFILGSLLLLLTAACRTCRDWSRKAGLLVVDICLWLMVISGAVSSLLFVTGVDSVEAYPDSVVLWPPVLYCAGWSLCLLSRLVIAACCDVHRDAADVTLPFV